MKASLTKTQVWFKLLVSSNWKNKISNYIIVTVVQLIALFLHRLQSPACLVAHNGNRFDFVILKKELEALKAQLPDNTYCVDSLPLFQALEQDRERKEKAVQENADNELADLELTAITAMEELEGSSSTLSQMQMLNETTPQRSKITENYKKALRSYLDVTPSTPDQPSQTSRQRKSPPRSKRQLFPTEGESSNSASPPSTPVPTTQLSPSQPKKRFRLCDVHERLLGVPPKISHYAECDVEALLKCAIAEGSAFVAYAEEHGVKFQDFLGNFWLDFFFSRNVGTILYHCLSFPFSMQILFYLVYLLLTFNTVLFYK